MKGLAGGLSAVVGSLLLGAVAAAAPRVVPTPPSRPAPARGAPAAPPASADVVSVTQASASAVADDPELQRLLDKLSALSEAIGRNAQAPDVWRTQLEQAGILLQVAQRSKAGEQDNWLRMAVDSYYSAAIQSPANDITVTKQLDQMPARIGSEFPKSALASYAALQVVQADYVRAIARDGAHPELARAQLHDGLLHFVKAYPKAPEAPKALMDAAEISEAVGKLDNARACYHYLVGHYAGQPEARKAGGALWRLGLAGEAMELELPLLFAPPASDHTFDLKELRGKMVVVYFWSSDAPEAAADLETLKDLASKYQDRDLEVVYVNMDQDQEKVRAFLQGRLTVGTHVFQAGGLEGPVAERYGIHALPQMFLIGRDGNLIRQSLQASQVEAEASGRLPRDR